MPLAFRAPQDVRFLHGADFIGLARWLCQAERREQALVLFSSSVALGLPDRLLFTLMRISLAAGAATRAMPEARCRQFVSYPPRRIPTGRKRSKNWPSITNAASAISSMALEMVEAARKLDDTANRLRHEAELRARVEKAQAATGSITLGGACFSLPGNFF